MLARLITTIICLIFLAFFAGFNLDNKCDVNLLFKTFESVPVFVSIIIAFVTGVVFTLPFVFIHKSKVEKKEKAKAEKKAAFPSIFKSKKEKVNSELSENNDESKNSSEEKNEEEKSDESSEDKVLEDKTKADTNQETQVIEKSKEGK